MLNELDDRELVKRYRLDGAGIVSVTDMVRDKLKRPTSRNKALSLEMQLLLVTLRYLATVKMQMCSADNLGPSQQTISRVISDARPFNATLLSHLLTDGAPRRAPGLANKYLQ